VLDFSKNHFELFGLPVDYRVDAAQLADRYRALQRALHPDRYVVAGDREKRLSMQASIRVNEAFQTLKDPLERARYLLSLYTDDSGGENETSHDMAFLMEQMELREALAEVKVGPAPGSALAEVQDRLLGQANELIRALEKKFRNPSAEALDEIRELIRKLQFVAKCRLDAESLEAELDEQLP
jgi:molecular chaperone HscB